MWGFYMCLIYCYYTSFSQDLSFGATLIREYKKGFNLKCYLGYFYKHVKMDSLETIFVDKVCLLPSVHLIPHFVIY